MSKAASLLKGHDEACSEEEARDSFQWWLSCGPSTWFKNHFHSQSVGGTLGGIVAGNTLPHHQAGSVPQSRQLNHDQVLKHRKCFVRKQKHEADSFGSYQICDWEDEVGESLWCILWRIFHIPLPESSYKLACLSGIIVLTSLFGVF